MMTFRIVSGTAPNFAARSVARLDDFQAPANAVSGFIDIVPVDGLGRAQGVPIAAGERVAIGRSSGTLGDGLIFTDVDESPGSGRFFRVGGIPDESDGTLMWSPAADQEILLQYTVEPDADGDNYGDESQDFCDGKAGTVYGCPESSVIEGTSGRDVIQGTPGNDLILARGGKDIVFGGDGNDVILGGGGKDRLFGGGGNDTLIGGAAKDRCDGGDGADTAKQCERRRNL